MKRSDQKKKMGENRRGIGFETVAGMGGGAIVETLLARPNSQARTERGQGDIDFPCSADHV